MQKDYDKSKAEREKREMKRQRIQREIDVSSSIETGIPSSTSKTVGSGSTSTPTKTGGTATLNTFWKPIEKQDVDNSIAELFYACAIPFNVAPLF